MHTEKSQGVKQARNPVEKKEFATIQQGSVESESSPSIQLAGRDSISLTFGTFEEVSESANGNVVEERDAEKRQTSASYELTTQVDPASEAGPSPSSGISSPQPQQATSPVEAKARSSNQGTPRASPIHATVKEGSHNFPHFSLGMHNIPKDMQRTSSVPPNPAEVGKLPPFLPDRFQHYVRNSFPYSGGNSTYGQPLTAAISVPFSYSASTAQETSIFGQTVPQNVPYTMYGPNQSTSFVNQPGYAPYSSSSPKFDSTQRQNAQVNGVSATGIVVPPKREKKRIPIIDPNTKQEIDLSSAALEKEKRRTSAASSPQTSSKSPPESYSTASPKQNKEENGPSLGAELEAKVSSSNQDEPDKLERTISLDETDVEKSKNLVQVENTSSECLKDVENQWNKTDDSSSTLKDFKNIEEMATVQLETSETMKANDHVDSGFEKGETEREESIPSDNQQVIVSQDKESSDRRIDSQSMATCAKTELDDSSVSQDRTVERVVSPRRERFTVRGGKALTSRVSHSRVSESPRPDSQSSNFEELDVERKDMEEERNVASTVTSRLQYTLEVLEVLKSVGNLDSFDERTQDEIKSLFNLSNKSLQSKKYGSMDKFPKNMFPGSNISGPPPGFGTKAVSGKDSYDLGRARNRSVPVPGSNSASARGRSHGGKELLDLRGTKVATPDIRITQAAQNWKHRRDDEDEFTRKIHTVRSILNKLTYEKFDRLYEQILEVKIDSPELLRGIVSEIFDKALLEPNFGPMYAELCDRLSVSMQKMLDESADGGFRDESGKKVTFKSILLSNCQTEFQKFAKCETTSEKAQPATTGTGEASPEANGNTESNLSTEEEEEERLKMKRRMIGNIKFIGELFKRDMISERVIRDDCIPRLLSLSLVQNPDEDDLESLCKLLTSVGAKLDSHVENRPMLDQYFQALDKFRSTVKLPSRIRFMIMDLFDLRKNNWVERRKEAQAKTIGEIHADAQREERAKALASRERVLSSRDRRTMSSVAYAPRMTMHMGTSSPRSAGVSQRVEANWEKIGAKKPDWKEYAEKVELGPVRLGPSSGILSMAGGARGWKTDSGASDARRTETVNSSSTTDSRPKSILSHSVSVSAEVSNASVDIPKEEELDTSCSMEPEGLSLEAFSRRLKSILEEFHSLKDVKEAEESLKEIPKSNMETFVLQFVQTALESKTSVRKDAVILFTIAKDLLSPDVVRNGFVSVMELLDDLDIDDPHASDFVASLIGRAASVGMLGDINQENTDYGLNFLQESLANFGDSTRRLKFVILVFKELRLALRESDQGDSLSRVLQAMRNSGLDLERLSLEWNDRNSLYSLLRKLDASYLCLSGVIRSILMPPNEDTQVDSADILLNLLQNLDEEVKQSTETISALGYLYFEILHLAHESLSVTDDANSYNMEHKSQICERALRHLLSDDIEKHLTLLVTAQQFCHDKSFPLVQVNVLENDTTEKRQISFIRHIFDQLYKSKIVSVEAFWNWKEDLTVTQPLGKGQALIQTNEWFSHLSGLNTNNSEDEEGSS